MPRQAPETPDLPEDMPDEMPGDMPEDMYVIVDADTLAGWRRVESSLAQLHEAVRDLHRQAPRALVAVVGDPSLKWALPESERDELEEDIASGRIVFAPAGAVEGHIGFIARIADRARARGLSPVAITDRAIPNCPLARVRREGVRWVFDLDGFEATVQAPTSSKLPVWRRRNRSK